MATSQTQVLKDKKVNPFQGTFYSESSNVLDRNGNTRTYIMYIRKEKYRHRGCARSKSPL